MWRIRPSPVTARNRGLRYVDAVQSSYQDRFAGGAIGTLSDQLLRFMVAAVRAYGPGVLASADGAGDDAEAALGREALAAVFGAWRSAASLDAVLADLAASPASMDALAALSSLVGDVLDEAPELESALTQELADFYRREFEAGDAAAMADLGDLLRFRGIPEEAQAAYRQAVEAGHTRGLIDLGGLHELLGDPEAARAAYAQAAETGDPDVAAEAQVKLGSMLSYSGRDDSAAEEAFQRAVETRHPVWAAAGLEGLAAIRHRQGDLDGERAIYQHLIDSGDASSSGSALLGLGVLLESQGDVDGARAAYWQLVNSGTPEKQAAHALVSLLNLLRRDGDLDEARAAYGKAAESGNPEAPYGLIVIGQLLSGELSLVGRRPRPSARGC
jgi:tetratricopeptide (TPR) repeat protein